MNIKTTSIKIAQNIHKLEVKKYKYKELCEIFEIEPTGGNSKKAQLKEVGRYARLEKAGHHFIVHEMYDWVQLKEDGRVNDSEYFIKLQQLILDLLARGNFQVRTDDFGHALVGKASFIRSLAMVNSNFEKYKTEQQELADLLDVPVTLVQEWYNLNPSKFERDIDSALKQLNNRGLVEWSKVSIFNITTIVDGVSTSGEPTSMPFTTNREATEEELALLIEAKEETLDLFGCKTISEIITQRRYREYVQEVSATLRNLYDIEGLNFYYTGYKIIFNNKAFKAFEDDEQVSVHRVVNSGVKDSLVTNAQKRQDKAIDIRVEDMTYMGGYRRCNTYVPQMLRITNELVTIVSLFESNTSC